jgi:L-iditol 2-dehydrogenase
MKPGNSCLVTGAGMIGIFLIKLLKVSGPSVIIATDINLKRLEPAKSAGADITLQASDGSLSDRIKSITNGRGADVAFDVAGTNDSFNNTISNIRKGGTVVLIGNITPVVEFPLQKAVTGELKILGSCAICSEYDTVLDYLKTGKITVDDQIAQVAPLSEGAYWFDRLNNKKDVQGKVILVP